MRNASILSHLKAIVLVFLTTVITCAVCVLNYFAAIATNKAINWFWYVQLTILLAGHSILVLLSIMFLGSGSQRPGIYPCRCFRACAENFGGDLSALFQCVTDIVKLKPVSMLSVTHRIALAGKFPLEFLSKHDWQIGHGRFD